MPVTVSDNARTARRQRSAGHRQAAADCRTRGDRERTSADRERIGAGQRMDGLRPRGDLDRRIAAQIDRDIVARRRHGVVRPVAGVGPGRPIAFTGPGHVREERARLQRIQLQDRRPTRPRCLATGVDPSFRLPHVENPRQQSRSILGRPAGIVARDYDFQTDEPTLPRIGRGLHNEMRTGPYIRPSRVCIPQRSTHDYRCDLYIRDQGTLKSVLKTTRMMTRSSSEG